MSQPLVSFEVREKYLLVVGHGKRDNLLAMSEAADMIVKKAVETNRHFMLVDYRNLEVGVHMADAFNIVRGYEAHQPDLRNITVAAVFSAQGHDFGNFWTEVGRKRGFRIESFEDIDEAEQWLLKQVSS